MCVSYVVQCPNIYNICAARLIVNVNPALVPNETSIMYKYQWVACNICSARDILLRCQRRVRCCVCSLSGTSIAHQSSLAHWRFYRSNNGNTTDRQRYRTQYKLRVPVHISLLCPCCCFLSDVVTISNSVLLVRSYYRLSFYFLLNPRNCAHEKLISFTSDLIPGYRTVLIDVMIDVVISVWMNDEWGNWRVWLGSSDNIREIYYLL